MTGKRDNDGAGTQKRHPTNAVASITQRLLNLARQQHQEFQLLLTQYAVERLLYRLGQSPYADQFVVKGAVLFALWQGSSHRATRDLDLLGYGTPDLQRLEEVFRHLCHLPMEEDGLTLVEEKVRVTPIREDQEYGGIRIQLLALLGKARIQLHIDVGFGDAVTPAPKEITFPTLLDLPAPLVRVYPRETVVAETFEAMVRLGMANTRMKDIYDLWILAKQFAFDGALFSEALSATFSRRSTPIPPGVPLAFTPEFTDDAMKQTQWAAFLAKGRLEEPTTVTLTEVVTLLRAFLEPVVRAADNRATLDKHWPPNGPWQPTSTELSGQAVDQ